LTLWSMVLRGCFRARREPDLAHTTPSAMASEMINAEARGKADAPEQLSMHPGTRSRPGSRSAGPGSTGTNGPDRAVHYCWCTLCCAANAYLWRSTMRGDRRVSRRLKESCHPPQAFGRLLLILALRVFTDGCSPIAFDTGTMRWEESSLTAGGRDHQGPQPPPSP
jgi:hypothetical protein